MKDATTLSHLAPPHVAQERDGDAPLDETALWNRYDSHEGFCHHAPSGAAFLRRRYRTERGDADRIVQYRRRWGARARYSWRDRQTLEFNKCEFPWPFIVAVLGV